MKSITPKIFKTLTLLAVICSLNTVFAQSPNKFSYQAVVRNASNVIVASAPVGMRVSILQTSATGTAVYVETHNPTTNANGLASIEIGGGTLVSGNFATIDWANGPYFIKTDTDPAGGTSYSITGTSQLLSVPYAMASADNKWTGTNNILNTNATGITNIISTSINPLRIAGGDGMKVELYEGANQRGYIGSTLGNSNDFEIGIPTSNPTGNIVFTTAAAPQLTVAANGNVGVGTQSPSSKLEVNGFTKLGFGAPAIKVKKTLGSTAATQGAQVSFNHNLDSTKIISATVLVEYSPGIFVPASYSGTGYEFNFIINTTSIIVQNSATNSSLILNKPYRIMITYEE